MGQGNLSLQQKLFWRASTWQLWPSVLTHLEWLAFPGPRTAIERPVSKCPTDLAPTLRASRKVRHAQAPTVVFWCLAGNSTWTVFPELWREGKRAGVTLPLFFFFFFPVWPNHTAYGILATQVGIKARCPVLKALRPKPWTTGEFPCSHF